MKPFWSHVKRYLCFDEAAWWRDSCWAGTSRRTGQRSGPQRLIMMDKAMACFGQLSPAEDRGMAWKRKLEPEDVCLGWWVKLVLPENIANLSESWGGQSVWFHQLCDRQVLCQGVQILHWFKHEAGCHQAHNLVSNEGQRDHFNTVLHGLLVLWPASFYTQSLFIWLWLWKTLIAECLCWVPLLRGLWHLAGSVKCMILWPCRYSMSTQWNSQSYDQAMSLDLSFIPEDAFLKRGPQGRYSLKRKFFLCSWHVEILLVSWSKEDTCYCKTL